MCMVERVQVSSRVLVVVESLVLVDKMSWIRVTTGDISVTTLLHPD
jgi:hypothetical protein